MQDAKVNVTAKQGHPGKFISVAMILLILIVVGLFLSGARRAQANSPEINVISQSALEENYGLRVQLVAVTAAGGLVDLRLQIVDADKAKAFLADRTNFPSLRVGNDVLRAAEDVAKQEIQFENGKGLFVLFPNTSNILKPGDAVNIAFGDIQLEAIYAK